MDNQPTLVGRNISHLLRVNDITPYALAGEIGIPQPTIFRIIRGESRDPKNSTLEKIAQYFGIPVSALRERDLEAQEALKGMGARPVEAINDGDEQPDAVRIRRVKLRVSAGISGFAADPVEEDDSPIFFRKHWYEQRGYDPKRLIAIQVKGESMEPRMSDGDTVVINTADKEPRNGEIFVVNYEGEVVIKRLRRDYGLWFLYSDNQDQRKYPPQRCEGDGCIILGKVVHLQTESL